MSSPSNDTAAASEEEAAAAIDLDQEMDEMLSTLTRRRGQLPATTGAVSAEAEQLIRERDEYRADLQRLAAEFDNYQKRAQREKETVASMARIDLVRQMLPVLDNLERALEVVGDSDQSEIAEGMRMVQREVRSIFAHQGVEEIDTDGLFDPHQHEPLMTVPSDKEEGTIVNVLQRGYRIDNHVLRPARVSVSAGKEQ